MQKTEVQGTKGGDLCDASCVQSTSCQYFTQNVDALLKFAQVLSHVVKGFLILIQTFMQLSIHHKLC